MSENLNIYPKKLGIGILFSSAIAFTMAGYCHHIFDSHSAAGNYECHMRFVLSVLTGLSG